MIPVDIVIARALHIIAGIVWVGVGFSATLILGSIVRSLGPQNAGAIVRAWYLNSPFLRAVPAAAIITVAAGLYLYGRRVPGTLVGSGDTLQQIVLGLGALIGLAAFGHGLFLSRLGNQYAAIAREAGTSPTPEQISQMGALGGRIGRNGPIISALMILSIIGMVLPRYL